MTRRALVTELLRSVAVPALSVITVIGTVAMFNDTEQWAGRWSALATYLRTTLILLVPLALAAGAWQGGRERRQRIGDLLTSTPRPAWQQATVRWGAVALGAGGGVIAVWTVSAAFVAPVATYSGGGWWWQSAVGVVAAVAAVAVGVAIGRLVPWRTAAPLLGLAGYVVLGVLTYAGPGDGRALLSPVLDLHTEGRYLPASFHALQALWFAALAAAVLTLAAARHRWVALAPAALAATAGTILTLYPVQDRWVDDPAALEPVCADGDPRLCTTKEMSFVLDDLLSVTGDLRPRLTGIDGAPDRIEGTAASDGSRSRGEVEVGLARYVDWRGGLSATDPWGFRLDDDIARAMLPDMVRCHDRRAPEYQPWTAAQVAHLWAGGTRDGIGATPKDYAAYRRLIDLPETERERWVERYIEAAGECDADTLTELTGELT